MSALLLSVLLATAPANEDSALVERALYGSVEHAAAQNETSDKSSSADLRGLWIALMLGLVGGGGLFVYRRRQQAMGQGGTALVRLASLSLGANQGVALLQIADEQLLVSTGSGGVRTLRHWQPMRGPVSTQQTRTPTSSVSSGAQVTRSHASREAQELDSWLSDLARSKSGQDDLDRAARLEGPPPLRYSD